MFWNRFYELCTNAGTKPNPIGKELGISSGAITKWKNGAIPSGETLALLADYFEVSVDYLLGRDEKKPDTNIGAELKEALASADEETLTILSLLAQLPPDKMLEEVDYLRAILKHKREEKA